MPRNPTQASRGEEGIALLVAVLLLLVLSAVAVASIDHSGSEAELSGRMRRTMATFQAADGGIEFAESRLARTPPRLDPFNVTYANGSTVRSGTRTDGAAQQIISAGVGPPPEGFSINLGSSGYAASLYRTAVTGSDIGTGTVELEAKYSRFEAGIGGY